MRKSTMPSVWPTGCPKPFPFAPAWPETEICGLSGLTGMDGVTFTCTEATAFTARGPMVQRMIAPCAAVQVPPLLAVAVGTPPIPVVGTMAWNWILAAGSGPVLVMSNVNAAGVPAGTGLGLGLEVGAETTMTLLALSLATNASGAEPFNDP